MKIIVIGTVVVYCLYLLTGGQSSAISFLSFNLVDLLHGEIWRLITFIFVPTNSNPIWLIISLFFYYYVGTTLEREWGTAKFNIYYFSGMALTLLCVIILSLATGVNYSLASTSYINMSMFFAFAMLYPDAIVLLLIITVKIKYLAWFFAALFAVDILISLFSLSLSGVLLPIVALLNFFIFFANDLLPSAIVVGAVMAVTYVAAVYARRQLGGMSGDIAGYSIVWGELAGIFAMLVM